MLKRRRRPGYAAGLAAVMVLGAAGLAGAGPAAAATASAPVGAAPRLPAGARVIGPEPGPALLHVTVALRPADPGGLGRLAAQVATPGTRAFRHFLRPAQVRDRFGPRPGAAGAVGSWLRSQHLSTGPASGDGLLLPVSGLATRIEAAFRTAIDEVRLPGGRTARVNRQAPRVPAALHRWISAVIGLDNLYLPQPALARGAVPGPQACRAARATPHVYPAAALARAYQFGPLYRRGDFGQHVTVALFELADYADSDIAAYNRCYGVDPSVRRVRVNGGTTVAANPGGTVEETADLEVIAAFAPAASILAYEAPISDGLESYLDNYGAIVQQDRAQVVSSSWGYCEPVIPQSMLRVEAQLFQEMALQGQSMMAAAGDAGSEDCLRVLGIVPSRLAYSLQVGDPASQPFVTAIGGTAITRYGSPPAESAWNQTPGGNGYPAPFDGQAGRPGTRATTSAAAGSPGGGGCRPGRPVSTAAATPAARPAAPRPALTAVRSRTCQRWPPPAVRRPVATSSTARRAASTAPAG